MGLGFGFRVAVLAERRAPGATQLSERRLQRSGGGGFLVRVGVGLGTGLGLGSGLGILVTLETLA